MDEPRILEAGLAVADTSVDCSISPTETFCEQDLPTVCEKYSEVGSIVNERPLQEENPSSRSRWFQLWNRDETKNAEPSPLQVRTLGRFPKGYPNLAAFQDSDESFMIYRRFGYLQSRVLLNKQDEMRCLEEQLDELDESDRYESPMALYMRESDEGHVAERQNLLTQIERKYLEYARFLNAAHQLATLNKPGSGEYESVSNYLTGRTPVDGPEREYINYKEDLVSLRPGREHAWLDTIIEKSLKTFRCKPLDYLFCDELARRKSDHEEAAYYSRDRVEKCAVVCITIMILALLVVPIYLLYTLVNNNISNGTLDGKRNAVCIGVLLVFTLAFSAMMSLFTRAKRHEILGAAAAYCAVLVVFLGNVGNTQS